MELVGKETEDDKRKWIFPSHSFLLFSHPSQKVYSQPAQLYSKPIEFRSALILLHTTKQEAWIDTRA